MRADSERTAPRATAGTMVKAQKSGRKSSQCHRRQVREERGCRCHSSDCDEHISLMFNTQPGLPDVQVVAQSACVLLCVLSEDQKDRI